MKFRFLIAVALVFVTNGIACAGISDWIYGQSWEFMVSVGGIKVDEPIRKSDGTAYLPVRCDVSGLTTITNKPTMINSALVVTGIDKKIEDKQILISVNTGLASKNSTCACSGIELGNISSGDYQVYYYGSDREKHLLGNVTVPAK